MADDKPPKRAPSIMGDDDRANIGRDARRNTPQQRPVVPSPVEADREPTPPPRAIDPAMQELIDRFWPLRHIDRDHADDRMRDQERVIALSTEIAVVKSKLDGITKFGDALDKLEDLDHSHARTIEETNRSIGTMRKEIWGETPRKPDEPSIAEQARSGRKLLRWVLAIVTAIAAAGGGGILVSVRKSGEAEGEEREWRSRVNSEIRMLFRAVFKYDPADQPSKGP